VHPLPATAAPLLATFAAGAVDEDPPPGLGRGGKEVGAAVSVLGFFPIHQAQICLMHECRRLKRLPPAFVVPLLRGERAELVVDQGQELRGGVRVPLLDGGQDTRDVGHSGQSTARGTTRLARRWPEACRVALGGYPPRAPTDPDVRNYRIRLVRSTLHTRR